MLVKMVQILLIITSLYSILEAGDPVNSIPVPVQSVLEKAGDNRAELELVIRYYTLLGDSLGLQAAYFLIANMEGHSYVKYSLCDSAGNEINFNVMSYQNYDLLLKDWARLEKENPGLDFKKKEMVDDIQSIDAQFLLNNIHWAIWVWKNKPWAKALSFESFCEYILPYRGSNEPIEDWRGYFFNKYFHIDTLMTNPADPIEAARIINKDVMTYFTFDPRYYYHPTDQGLSEMLAARLGRCEDMTNITIYAMRANGLAVTSDYTPYWANSGNNHAWNAILVASTVTADCRVVPFMGAEANPGEYSLWNKLAKVYRKMYSQQPDNLIFQPRKQEKVPGWLAGKSYIDVTKAYVNTSDITIPLEKASPDTVDIAYICVFNDGEWRPIHWGRIENGHVTFTDMGTEIAYLPAYYVNEDSLDPAGPPLILHEDGNVAPFVYPFNATIDATLISTTEKVQQVSTDGVDTVYLESGKSYELSYWDYGWQSLGNMSASNGPLVFAHIPAGRLFWLVAEGSNKDERIFTIENGKQVWW